MIQALVSHVCSGRREEMGAALDTLLALLQSGSSTMLGEAGGLSGLVECMDTRSLPPELVRRAYAILASVACHPAVRTLPMLVMCIAQWRVAVMLFVE